MGSFRKKGKNKAITQQSKRLTMSNDFGRLLKHYEQNRS